MDRRLTNSTANGHPSSDVHHRSTIQSQEPSNHLPRPNERAATIDYRLESNRLKTFQFWPYQDWIKPKKLAEAGFYYIGGNTHAVKCFACHYILPAFYLSERPMVHHQRYSQNCQFVQNYFRANVPIDTEIGMGAITFCFVPPENISEYLKL